MIIDTADDVTQPWNLISCSTTDEEKVTRSKRQLPFSCEIDYHANRIEVSNSDGYFAEDSSEFAK